MLKIGVAQSTNRFALQENLDAILRAIKKLSEAGADLILFPECALTGYHTGLLELDHAPAARALRRAQKSAARHSVALLLPVPLAGPTLEHHLNCALLIGADGKIQRKFTKRGLMRGEKRIFTPEPATELPDDRVIEIKGYRLGLLICIEAAHDPWAYLDREGTPMDAILWPGFWAWPKAFDWDAPFLQEEHDEKTRANCRQWKTPLIQATFGDNPQAQMWPDKIFGGSLVIDSAGKCIHCAPLGREATFIVELPSLAISHVD